MATVSNETLKARVERKTNRATTKAYISELAGLDPNEVTEDKLQEFFSSLKSMDREIYDKFLYIWGLPYDHNAPKWAAGKNDALKPEPDCLRAYFKSLKKMFKAKLKHLKPPKQ